jgi:hypothetical protein
MSSLFFGAASNFFCVGTKGVMFLIFEDVIRTRQRSGNSASHVYTVIFPVVNPIIGLAWGHQLLL